MSRYIRAAIPVCWFLSLLLNHGSLCALEISDTPLESAVYSPPANLMLVLDNSGSMDWEFMTPEEEGLFQGCMYLFSENAYQPAPDHRYASGSSLTAMQKLFWRSQWAGYNHIYFNPNKTYAPWPSTQRHVFEQADLNRPWSNPMRTQDHHVRIDLSAAFYSLPSGAEVIRVANAHYFSHDDENGNGRRDTHEAIYLVTWVDQDNDGQIDLGGSDAEDRRLYYRFIDDGDGFVEAHELHLLVSETEKNRARPTVVNTRGNFIRFQTDRESLQNFANWCTYYRRRLMTLKAAAAKTINRLSRIHIGLCGVNGRPRMGVLPAGALDGAIRDNKGRLLEALYALQSRGRTPLRSALDRVGRYFRREEGTGIDPPFDPPAEGGSCRRHIALVVSDGFWNGSFSGVGNADGGNGAPYADTHSDTLADVAAHHYDNDLNQDIDDGVPPSGCADASHQHMETWVLSFGLNGTIAVTDMDGNGVSDLPGFQDDPCLRHGEPNTLPWPRPVALPGHEASGVNPSGSGALLDDLLHTAINGHGRYFEMASSRSLNRDLMGAAPQNRQANVAGAITLNHNRLNHTTVLYRTAYDPAHWQGEVSAWGYDDDNNSPFGRLMWQASEQYQQPGINEETRCVITHGSPGDQNRGIPFRYSHFNRDQQEAIAEGFYAQRDPDQMARDLIAYVRGATFPYFRARTSQLGDIVHSTPVVEGNTLFVGANDGMLHALDAQSGLERFAYVPTQLFEHLKALSDPGYGGRHRFYVDGPLWAGEVAMERYRRRSYLVGALGQGGRGYFCLLAGARSRARTSDGYGDYQWDFHVDQLATPSDEDQASRVVQWEYPHADPANDGKDNNNDGMVDEPGEMDPDIGYAFGQGYAVNANCAEEAYRPVVIFGNGYNSPGQRAVLYVLDAHSGEVVRKIDTGVAMNNGLSTPALIDVNRDNRIDYAYAGDLHGNLWRFDLRSNEPDQWGVAYGEDRNGDDVIDAAAGDLPQPLFQATGQSITSRPDIMAMATACNPQVDGYMVIFGTGRYLSIGDQYDTSQQSIYGIWDYGQDANDHEHLGALVDRSSGLLSTGLHLLRQTVTGQATTDGSIYRQVSQHPVYYPTAEERIDPSLNGGPDHHYGWFLDFPVSPDPLTDEGERVIGRTTLRGGTAVVASLVPEHTPCRSGGSSWIYLLGGCNGSSPGAAANTFQVAKRYAGPIYAHPIIVKDPSHPHQDQLILPDQTGGVLMEAIVGEVWGQAYWWQNID